MLSKYINIPLFLVALSIGIFAVYITVPEEALCNIKTKLIIVLNTKKLKLCVQLTKKKLHK